MQADPRSPEHGQYGFLQDLVRHVAYETLSKRERRAQAPRRCRDHEPDACRRRGRGGRGDRIPLPRRPRGRPRRRGRRRDQAQGTGDARPCGERAESLAAAAEARALLRAGGGACTDDRPSGRRCSTGPARWPRGRAIRTRLAGSTESRSSCYEAARRHACRRPRARAGSRRLDAFTGRRDEATGTHGASVRRPLGRRARRGSRAARGAPCARLLVQRRSRACGRARRVGARHRRGACVPGGADGCAEGEERGRRRAVALRGVPGAPEAGTRDRARTRSRRRRRQRATSSSPTSASDRDAYADALGYLDEALALSRKVGNRPQEWAVLAERTYPLCMLGRWDEAQAASAEFTPEKIDTGGIVLSLLQSAVEIHIQRGELDGARRIFSMFSRLEESTDVQERSCYLGSRAALRRAEGRSAEALADGEATIEAGRTLGISAPGVKAGPRRGDGGGVRAGRVGEARGAARSRRERSGRLAAAVPRRAGEALPRPPGRRRGRVRSRRRAASASWACPSGSRSRCSSTAS